VKKRVLEEKKMMRSSANRVEFAGEEGEFVRVSGVLVNSSDKMVICRRGE
jgi:hypothetical protein